MNQNNEIIALGINLNSLKFYFTNYSKSETKNSMNNKEINKKIKNKLYSKCKRGTHTSKRVKNGSYLPKEGSIKANI